MDARTQVATYPPLAYSLAVTTGAFGPALIALIVLLGTAPALPVPLTSIATGLVALVCGWLGARWWRSRPEADTISYSELLVWSWFRRLRAERTVKESIELLRGRREPTYQTLRQLAGALEVIDSYTHGHSRRVQELAVKTLVHMGVDLSDDALDDLRWAAVLHDIGKIEVPASILRKEGALTPEERAAVEKHVHVGARLVAGLGSTAVVAAVLHHHERWDGKGYPHGLAGEDVPLFARVIAVVDAFDAMVSSRPYRAGMGKAHALSVLRSEAGDQFDPCVVAAFEKAARRPLMIPVMAPLWGRVAAWVRESEAWAHRTGSGVVGSAAAGAAAIAVVGGGLHIGPVPDAGLDPTPRPPVSSAGAETVSDADPATVKERPKPGPSRPAVRGRRAPATSDGPSGVKSAASAPAEVAERESPDGADEPDSPPATRTKPGDGSPPEDPGEDAPGDGGDGGGRSRAMPKPSGDPQPDKGKDCEVPPSSPGKDTHCG